MNLMMALVLVLIPTGNAFAGELDVEWVTEPVSIEENWTEFLEKFVPSMNSPEDFLTARHDTIVPVQPQMKIATLANVPETLLIAFNYGVVMNLAFMRASVFIEKLSGPLFSDSPPYMVGDHPLTKTKALLNLIPGLNGGGHDLRAKDLLTYWEILDQQDGRIVRPVRASPLASIQGVEAQTRKILEPYLRANPNTALVIFSIAPFNEGVVTHEISHAQYFNNPAYRDAVHNYWNKLSEQERARIRIYLNKSNVGYGGMEDLMINEFQAYLTSINANLWKTLGPFLDPHFSLLRAHIFNTVAGSRFIDFPTVPRHHRNPLCSKYLMAGLPE